MSDFPLAAIPRPDAESARMVQLSIRRLAGREQELTAGFYRNLFAMLPAVRPLFPEDMAEQRTRLLTALLASVDSLDDPAGMESRLQALGAIHYQRGIADDQYQYVAHALVRTVRDVVPGDWSTWLSSAWISVFSWMIAHMVLGAQLARARAEAGARQPDPARQPNPARPQVFSPEQHAAQGHPGPGEQLRQPFPAYRDRPAYPAAVRYRPPAAVRVPDVPPPAVRVPDVPPPAVRVPDRPAFDPPVRTPEGGGMVRPSVAALGPTGRVARVAPPVPVPAPAPAPEQEAPRGAFDRDAVETVFPRRGRRAGTA
jgi:hemoglobin-like flavoprotein